MTVGFSWISLDSLVRIETYQWVTRHKPNTKISARFCPLAAFEETGTAPVVEVRRKGRIVHAPSLTQFLNFWKRFLSKLFALGRLIQCSPPQSAVGLQPRPAGGGRGGPELPPECP